MSSMPWQFSSGSKKKTIYKGWHEFMKFNVFGRPISTNRPSTSTGVYRPELCTIGCKLTIEVSRFYRLLNTWTTLWSNVLKIGNESIYNQYKVKVGIFFERIAKVFALPCTDSAALIRVHIKHMSRSYKIHKVCIIL